MREIVKSFLSILVNAQKRLSVSMDTNGSTHKIQFIKAFTLISRKENGAQEFNIIKGDISWGYFLIRMKESQR